MDAPFLPYLNLLRELAGKLDQLSQYAQDKVAAVRQDDLLALDEVMKQEQVLALSLRGLEQKRKTLLGQLNLSGVPLAELSKHYPEALTMEAKEATERLQHSYRAYRSYADAARNTLELNLHKIEKVISDAGIEPGGGPGFATPEVEPPKNMKSDFRA